MSAPLMPLCSQGQLARFWSKIRRDGPTVSPGLGPCWLWTGAPTAGGYGLVTAGSQRTGTRTRILAHRLMWELTNSPIPDGDGYHGTCVMHRCDVRNCVNPDHLIIGSQADNLRDMRSKHRGRVPGYRGTQHPGAKLTKDDVQRIRTSGEGVRALGRALGVTHQAIIAIRKGRLWRHL